MCVENELLYAHVKYEMDTGNYYRVTEYYYPVQNTTAPVKSKRERISLMEFFHMTVCGGYDDY